MRRSMYSAHTIQLSLPDSRVSHSPHVQIYSETNMAPSVKHKPLVIEKETPFPNTQKVLKRTLN
jgi:hypothetical protein